MAHLICSQLVLQHQPKRFRWSLQPRQSGSAEPSDGSLPCATEFEAAVDFYHEVLQRLPILSTVSKDVERPRKGDFGFLVLVGTLLGDA